MLIITIIYCNIAGGIFVWTIYSTPLKLLHLCFSFTTMFFFCEMDIYTLYIYSGLFTSDQRWTFCQMFFPPENTAAAAALAVVGPRQNHWIPCSSEPTYGVQIWASWVPLTAFSIQIYSLPPSSLLCELTLPMHASLFRHQKDRGKRTPFGSSVRLLSSPGHGSRAPLLQLSPTNSCLICCSLVSLYPTLTHPERLMVCLVWLDFSFSS
jgi:hypothetical protein